MIKIICFGDSNTFGFNPKDGSRYDSDTRWTGVLAKILKDEFEIVEEGCNNRTGFFLNPDGHLQSGQKYLPECIKKHKGFDFIILAIGTNDLQIKFKIDENIANDGLKNLITIIREFNKNSRIIVIPPVILDADVLKGYFNYQFDEESIKASLWIQEIYEKFCSNENCELFNINNYVKPSNIDGLHFDEQSHKYIAKILAAYILKSKSIKNFNAKIANNC